MGTLYVPEHVAVARTIQSYQHPDWLVAPPAAWEVRLREVSPIVERTSHLRFRWFSAYQTWVLYQCTPKALVSSDRHEQLSSHWSTLATESERIVRRQHVSDYQYWMYSTHGLEACPFLILQGDYGGTPAAWTERERKILQFKMIPEDVPPLGAFDPCPFDERTVAAIHQRDRLLRAEAALQDLERYNSAPAYAAQLRAAEREYRHAVLTYVDAQAKEMGEYITAIQARAESAHLFRGNDVAQGKHAAAWHDQYVETGIAPDGSPTSLL